MNVLYFDCIGGISGDMILASLVDAGLEVDYLKSHFGKLNISGYDLKVRKTTVDHINATKLDININKNTPKFKNLNNIRYLINKSSLKESVKELSLRIFTNLAKAEAKVHGVPYEKVIFHQLCELDTVIDIVGFAIGVDYFKIEEFYCSKIKLAQGINEDFSHRIPIPAPAVLSLLKNFPIEFQNTKDELVTPTGAAIIGGTVKNKDVFPDGYLFKIGYSTGTKKLENLNLLRLIILQKEIVYQKDSIIVLETNIDDMNPESIEYLFEKLINVGALDVYITNIIMKKSRPAFLITILTPEHLLSRLSTIIYSESTTLGIRYYKVNRNKLDRSVKTVNTKFGKVKVKVGIRENLYCTISPEYEDCKKIAFRKNIPFKQVYEEAKNVLLKRSKKIQKNTNT